MQTEEDDIITIDPENKEKTVDVYFQIYSPAVATRSLDLEPEDDIQTVQLLAFRVESDDKKYFSYYASGRNIEQVDDSIQFVVPLKLDGIKYQFVILANADKEVTKYGNFSTNSEKEALLARIIAENEEKWDLSGNYYTPIPMWGEYPDLIEVKENLKLPGISLTRSLAKVSITMDSEEIHNDFKIKSVYLYNANSKGTIIPDPDNWNSADSIVTAPTIPGLNQASIRLEDSLIYDDLEYTNKVLNTIYTFESKGADIGDYENATCLVIGGLYKNMSDITYYRVDFTYKSNDELFFRDLLRNHHYQMNITSVIEPGYHTADSAFRYKKTNMVVEISTWKGENWDYDYPGNYNFTVSTSKITAPKDGYDGIIKVSCDHPDGWNIESLKDEEDNSFLASEIYKENDTTLRIKLPAISGNRKGAVTLKAGNLMKRIFIEQS